MAGELEQLMEMGFPQNRAEKALAKTQFSGVERAMEWLLAHSEDADIDDPFTPDQGQVLGKREEAQPMEHDRAAEKVEASEEKAEGSEENAEGSEEKTEGSEETDTNGAPQQAKSLKCDDCGRLLKSELDLQAHAARTGHANFSESTEEFKPLTEDEKKEQLAKLQEKLKARRLEKEEQERKEQLQREKMRRTQGKDMGSIKQKFEEKEMKKLAEQRKREKQEDKIARQKIKEEIERDKRDRATKFVKQSAPSPADAAAATATQQPATKKNYDQCRLQIRLTNGAALTQAFGTKEPLSAVRLYIQMNRSDGDGAFTLMTSFPRKVFSEDDMDKPLFDLDLVPSAVLIVTKTH